MKRFTIQTLGCKVNQYESEYIAGNLESLGMQRTDREGDADVCIVNTCTVTSKAAMQSRQAVNRMIRTHPKAWIILTGCYAQTAPVETLRGMKGIKYIVGHADKHRIPEIIRTLNENDTHTASDMPVILRQDVRQSGSFGFIDSPTAQDRTRAYLKIQDGCDAFCSYCIVPWARGKSRSMPPGDVLRNALRLENAGYGEIIVTGIHLGAYGIDFSPPTGLRGILSRILNETRTSRLRISSLEPKELTDGLIRTLSLSERFCDHFHIPLQSGDDTVLSRMRRPYDTAYFRDLVHRILDTFPEAAVGADILVGFPGEKETEFENTRAFIASLPLAYLHVFPFSPREKTPAYSFPNRVLPEEQKRRASILRRLGAEKRRLFYEARIGKRVQILVEGKRDRETDLLKGLTTNYIPVLFHGDDSLKNTMREVLIERVDDDNRVFGRP